MGQSSPVPNSQPNSGSNSIAVDIVVQFVEEQRWLRWFAIAELVILGFAFVVNFVSNSSESTEGVLIADAIVGTTIAFAIILGVLGLILAVGLFVVFVRSGAWKRG
ncbi:hypothetical protein [Halomontanus rarus]|uniref:hypothetical protein n=1 Tax=Halomontanus rarus TaxID=3034020 RepID=UPI00293C056F|nr:hypothetical protein [Halovivax sp. KZCA124]